MTIRITTVLHPDRVAYAPRKIWLVKELERVIVETDAPARVRPNVSGHGPNVFFALGEALSYTGKLTAEWLGIMLDEIDESKLHPVHDSDYWEALARLEWLQENGWPLSKE